MFDRMVDAGMIPVGKTNCQEFSYGIIGDESAFGCGRNPVNTEFVTGGSSFGSAIAVALNFAPVAVGTDTAGSVRVPASCMNLVGLKPTQSQIPVDGVFPLAPTYDTVGLMSKSVNDITQLLFAVSNHNVQQWPPLPDRPVCIGTLGVSDTGRAALKAAVDERSQLSVVFDSADQLLDFDYIHQLYEVIRLYESYHVHRVLLQLYPNYYMPGVKEKLLGARAVNSAGYATAMQAMLDTRERLDNALWKRYDFLVCPTFEGPVPGWGDDLGAGAKRLTRFTVPFNVLDWPSVSLPDKYGVTPYWSLQVVGPRNRDFEVLRLAAHFEDKIGPRC